MGDDSARIKTESITKYGATSTESNQVNAPEVDTAKSVLQKIANNKYNILEDYIWTLSENKKAIIQNVPKLIATEYSIDTSPLIQNLKASYTVGKDAMTRSTAIGGEALNAISEELGFGKFKAITAPEWATTYLNKIGDTAIGKSVSNIFQKLSDSTGLKQESEMSWNSKQLQKLYDHLYTLKKTHNQFIFPYLDDNFLKINNSFSTGNEYLQFDVGAFSKDFSGLSETLKKLASIPALLSPGAYIQAPQFYDFGQNGEPSVTIKFPLYNIIDSYYTSKHMEFVKIFGLNNMPFRRDLIAVDPTKVYDIMIPGKANFPLCFISDYTVDHLGIKNFYYNDIYPEAYSVSITFKSLIKYDVNMYIDAMNAGNLYKPPPGRTVVSTPPQASVPPASPASNNNNEVLTNLQRNIIESATNNAAVQLLRAAPLPSANLNNR
jgi:hypothetical protein